MRRKACRRNWREAHCPSGIHLVKPVKSAAVSPAVRLHAALASGAGHRAVCLSRAKRSIEPTPMKAGGSPARLAARAGRRGGAHWPDRHSGPRKSAPAIRRGIGIPSHPMQPKPGVRDFCPCRPGATSSTWDRFSIETPAALAPVRARFAPRSAAWATGPRFRPPRQSGARVHAPVRRPDDRARGNPAIGLFHRDGPKALSGARRSIFDRGRWDGNRVSAPDPIRPDIPAGPSRE